MIVESTLFLLVLHPQPIGQTSVLTDLGWPNFFRGFAVFFVFLKFAMFFVSFLSFLFFANKKFSFRGRKKSSDDKASLPARTRTRMLLCGHWEAVTYTEIQLCSIMEYKLPQSHFFEVRSGMHVVSLGI